MTIDELTTFLGWCTVFNTAVLAFAGVAIMVAGDTMRGLHARLFGVGEEDLARIYFDYLAKYKILILVFNAVPWVALKAMA